MNSKRLLIINGYDFCSEKVYGIQRNAMEIIASLDTILFAEGKDIVAEVVVPEATDCVPRYECIKIIDLSCSHISHMDKIRWRNKSFPDYVGKCGGLGLDMILGLPHKGRCCVYDYDCIPERLPKSFFGTFATARAWHYKSRVRKSLNNAEVIFTDSEFAKSEIIDIYGIDSAKLVVIPCAWQHMLRVQQDDGVLERLGLAEGEYFFSLGSRYPYKNYRWVEAAARQNPRYRFVVTGSEIRRSAAHRGELPENLTFTGYLSDEEVKGLEAHCRAFLHPSLAEGFGIPPMEAMSAGARCIVSNRASLPEIYGDSVWYVDPLDYDNIDLDGIMSLPLRSSNEVVLSRYSWEESARLLLDTLERVMA